MKLLNPTSPIVNHTGGETLVPSCPNPEGCSKNDSDGIRIAVKDAFNQTITGGIADAGKIPSVMCTASQRVFPELQVLLVSTAILGEQVYLAEKGIIHVNNTEGVGVGSTSEILFRYGELETNLTFSTRECFPGEIESGNVCQPCLTDQYSFNTTSTCSDCEKHAKCSGGSSLVPVDGYWHSTPFSPQFHECIIKEACEYNSRESVHKDRESVLKEYYEDNHKISAEISELDVYLSQKEGTQPVYNDYFQCSDGYSGILCGSCEAGYGHFAGGECIKCPKHRGWSVILTILAAFIAFALLALNVLLTFNSTRKQVWVAIAKTRQAQQASPSRSADGLVDASSDAEQSGRRLTGITHLKLSMA